MDVLDAKSISILSVILLLDIIAMVVVVDLSSMTVNSSKSMKKMVMTIYFPQLGMQIKIRHDRMYHFHPPLPKILVMTNIANSWVWLFVPNCRWCWWWCLYLMPWVSLVSVMTMDFCRQHQHLSDHCSQHHTAVDFGGGYYYSSWLSRTSCVCVDSCVILTSFVWTGFDDNTSSLSSISKFVGYERYTPR